MDEMQRKILAAEKACRPDHYSSANYQDTPKNSRKFHPAFNLPQPRVLRHLTQHAESTLIF